MVTDLVQIGRLAEEGLQENLHFRRFLRAHHHSDDLLRETAQEIEEHIDCRTCANCCRQTRVHVSAREISSIAQHLGTESEEVIRQYTEKDQAEGGYMLRQVDGACVFLDRNLCTIYDARPRACREFPYLTTTETSLGHRLESIFRRAWMCPIVFNTLEAYKRRVGYHPPHPPGSA